MSRPILPSPIPTITRSPNAKPRVLVDMSALEALEHEDDRPADGVASRADHPSSQPNPDRRPRPGWEERPTSTSSTSSASRGSTGSVDGDVSDPIDSWSDTTPTFTRRALAWLKQVNDDSTTKANAAEIEKWFKLGFAGFGWFLNRVRRTKLRAHIPQGAAPSIWIPTPEERDGIIEPLSRIVGRHAPEVPQVPANDVTDAIALQMNGAAYVAGNRIREADIVAGFDPETGLVWETTPTDTPV
jgi:hypothetical protein